MRGTSALSCVFCVVTGGCCMAGAAAVGKSCVLRSNLLRSSAPKLLYTFYIPDLPVRTVFVKKNVCESRTSAYIDHKHKGE